MVDRMSEIFGYEDLDNLIPKMKKGDRSNNPTKPAAIKSMGTNKKSGVSAKELSKSDKAHSEGIVERLKYRNYYDINDTITTAQIIDPHDEDYPTYNRERVFESLERNAEILYVANDGTDTLFVIVSHQGGQNFAKERPIYPGDVKEFYNIYELRLRSPKQYLPYRVTEYEIDTFPLTYLTTQPLNIRQLTCSDKIDVCDNAARLLGIVTANAGINLNTSALALESGGNLDGIKANSDTLNSLMETAQELLSRIAGLANARGLVSDIRVTLLSGTVSVVANITSIGGIAAVQLIPSTQNAAAILSNIQNVGRV